MRQAAQIVMTTVQPNNLDGMAHLDVSEVLKQIAHSHGLHLLMKTSQSLTPFPGFDPVSFAFQECRSVKALVARWHFVIEHQSQIRCNQAGIPRHLVPARSDYLDQNGNTLYFNPAHFPMAQGVPGQSAMLAGMMIGILRSMGLHDLDVVQLTNKDAVTQVMKNGRFINTELDPDAAWIISWTEEPQTAGQEFRMLQGTVSSLSNFLDKPASGFISQIARLISPKPGTYLTAHDMAARLNMSGRTFTRRMAQESVSYKSLVRVRRFQHACTLMAEGETNLDELAFICDYSDRQYMSREFRYLGGISAAAFRDVLHTG